MIPGVLTRLQRWLRGDAVVPCDPTATQATDVIPGRWVGGICLLLGPIVLLAGILLRARFNFFFPDQLAAFQTHPGLITASYNTYAAGVILLWPAVLILARRVGVTHPHWAIWGGVLVMLGLFARTFDAGASHLVFEVARMHGAEFAGDLVGGTYPTFRIIQPLSAATLIGWIVLAIGAYRSRVLGLIPAVGLALMAAVPIGILKGTQPLSIAGATGLCIAMVPLGIKILREGPRPRLRTAAGWAAAVLAVGVAFVVLGLLG